MSVFGAFEGKLAALVQEAVREEKADIDRNREELQKREKRLEHYFSLPELTETPICLRVGDKKFYTTASILTKIPETYFCAMLSPAILEEHADLHKGKKPHELFIPRDPESFEIILEYLTYGAVYPRKMSRVLSEKLIADCLFYRLDDLATELKRSDWFMCEEKEATVDEKIEALAERITELQEREIPLIIGRYNCTTSVTNDYITWKVLSPPSSTHYFEVRDQEIRILRTGYYRISVQLCTTAHNAATEVFSLRRKADNVDLTRCYYTGNGHGAYAHSRTLDDCLELTEGMVLGIWFQNHAGIYQVNDGLTDRMMIQWMGEKLTEDEEEM